MTDQQPETDSENVVGESFLNDSIAADDETESSEPRKEYPYKESDYVVIGPEAFTGLGDTVISWRGENFYKACDFKVADFVDGGASHCVKRVNHPGKVHEDFDGRVNHEILGFNPDTIEVIRPALLPLGVPITYDNVQDAWNSFVLPAQQSGDAQSIEFRVIMACLRSIAEGLRSLDEVTPQPSIPPVELESQPVPITVIDEFDGPCEECGENEWRSEVVDRNQVLICKKCGKLRDDR